MTTALNPNLSNLYEWMMSKGCSPVVSGVASRTVGQLTSGNSQLCNNASNARCTVKDGFLSRFSCRVTVLLPNSGKKADNAQLVLSWKQPAHLNNPKASLKV